MRSIPAARFACLLACLAFFTAHGADVPPAATQCEFDLIDGSRVIGTPDLERLKLVTTYTNMELQLTMLRSIEFGATADAPAQIHLQNGDLITARLAAKEIGVKTSFGAVTIPISMVRKIQVSVSRKGWPEGLVLLYSFDRDEGDKVIDSSGSGNDGTIRNASYAAAGKVGGAMSFTGSRSGVVAKNVENLQLQDFTIMAWVKLPMTDMQGLLFGYGQNGYSFGIHNQGHLFLTKVGVNDVDSQCAIDDTAFHHVAITKKGDKVIYYLDGKPYPLEDPYDPGFEFKTDPAVGTRADLMDSNFRGLIDELAVFKRPLTDDEVKSVYDSQK